MRFSSQNLQKQDEFKIAKVDLRNGAKVPVRFFRQEILRGAQAFTSTKNKIRFGYNYDDTFFIHEKVRRIKYSAGEKAFGNRKLPTSAENLSGSKVTRRTTEPQKFSQSRCLRSLSR